MNETGPYFVFAYEDHYPSGGMGDYQGAYFTIDDALQAVRDGKILIHENMQIATIVDGNLEWIGDINPTGNVHYESADEVLRNLLQRTPIVIIK